MAQRDKDWAGSFDESVLSKSGLDGSAEDPDGPGGGGEDEMESGGEGSGRDPRRITRSSGGRADNGEAEC